MTTKELITLLELLGYLYVTVVDDNEGEPTTLTAVDPQGYQILISSDGETVLDRKWGSEHWDIMFIEKEAFL